MSAKETNIAGSPHSANCDAKPLVTVGIAAYNEERYVERAVASVLAQTFTDFELIIIDDASGDNTPALLRNISDARIRLLLEHENKGLACRLNQQIDLARGKYFVRMDADDIMMPERLARQVAYLESHPETDVCGTPCYVIDDEDRVLGTRRIRDKEIRSLMHPTVAGRIEWFRKYRYNEQYSGLEDFDLWLRSADASTFVQLSEPLMYYRDALQYDVQTVIRRRKLGLRVVYADRGYYHNPIVPYCILIKDVLTLPLIRLCALLGLDRFVIGRRNAAVQQ